MLVFSPLWHHVGTSQNTEIDEDAILTPRLHLCYADDQMGKTGIRRTETLQRGTYRYTAIFEPAEEGGYVVTVPALNGLTTEGDTFEEAHAMAADAIRCYLESLQKHGEEIPVESDAPIMRRIAVSLSRA